VPEILVYDTTQTLLPSEFFIMEFVPGVPFHKLRKELSADQQRQVETQMGRMCRQISEITAPAFGFWDQPELAGVSWRNTFDHMLQGIMQDAQDMHVDLEKSYDEVFHIFRKHYYVLDEVVVPRLVHWDMWDGNVFVDPASQQVTGLIDFERALWGDPLTESFFLNMPPTSGHLAGYGENLLGTPSQVRRRALYDTYLFLILIIECYFRHYPNNDQENWARTAIKELYKALE
jgi:aminoglycoside phosphotransferase (APT) family kinase protein